MKISKLGKVLLVCALGLVFVANLSFDESQKTGPLLALTNFTTINSVVVANTKHTVTIKGMTFNPAELHVQKGDTVVWINKDIVPHNITDFPGAKWTSGTLVLDGSWEKSISNSFDYYCSIHPTMKGKIIVDL